MMYVAMYIALSGFTGVIIALYMIRDEKRRFDSGLLAARAISEAAARQFIEYHRRRMRWNVAILVVSAVLCVVCLRWALEIYDTPPDG